MSGVIVFFTRSPETSLLFPSSWTFRALPSSTGLDPLSTPTLHQDLQTASLSLIPSLRCSVCSGILLFVSF